MLAEKYGIPTIPAADWNAARRFARNFFPLPGPGIRLLWASDGITITHDPGSGFRHPWQLAPRWRADDRLPAGGEWVSTVNPGFVNGDDATIEVVRVGRDPASLENLAPHKIHVPLTGGYATPTGPYSIETGEDAPEIVLGSFRNPASSAGLAATADGEIVSRAGEGYPAFFDSLGVVPPAAGGPIGEGASDETRTRQIRASDLVLIVPRFGSRQDINIRDPFTAAQTVEISTVFLNGRVASAPSRYYLVTLPKWRPADAPTMQDRLAGTAVETEQDELLIATVYFVSPPDYTDDAEVDSTWTPYVDYRVFWNLAWSSRAEFGTPPTAPISLQTGLAFGIGDALFNFLLSPVNDMLNAVQAMLGAADFHGLFWTPGALATSGLAASASGDPSTPLRTGVGLDTVRLRLVREAKAAGENVAPELNPAFPYLRQPFDPAFFGLFDTPARP